MAVTYQELLKQLRYELTGRGDQGTVYDDYTIGIWVRMALCDISRVAPYRKEITISVVSSSAYYYNLTSAPDLMDIERVECPSGEHPPVLWVRGDYTDPRFGLLPKRYDLVKYEGIEAPRLHLSQAQTIGDTITVLTLQPHPIGAYELTDIMTVPNEHIYVVLHGARYYAVLDKYVSAVDRSKLFQGGILPQNALTAIRQQADTYNAMKGADVMTNQMWLLYERMLDSITSTQSPKTTGVAAWEHLRKEIY